MFTSMHGLMKHFHCIRHRNIAFQCFVLTFWCFCCCCLAEIHDCGTHTHDEVTEAAWAIYEKAEEEVFGKRITDLGPTDFASIFQLLTTSRNAKKGISGKIRTFKSPREVDSSKQILGNNAYQLVGIPLVYHLLPNQSIGTNSKPTMTDAQLDYATKRTNELYQIYDRTSKQSVQFATFVLNDTIVHDKFVSNKDCGDLSEAELGSLVKTAKEWEYKFHLFICESSQFSGRASFPQNYPVDDPLHNVVLVDYRALACYDQSTGSYLCNDYDSVSGKPKSHTRWWRTYSTTMAHEIGHLFGLFHTFQGDSCIDIRGDGVPDTPHELLSNTDNVDNCPGLLPYDKDRSLFRLFSRKSPNKGDAQTCGSADNVCSSTCAACCDQKNCTLRTSSNEDITEDDVNTPSCCDSPKPLDSCPLRLGIDPKNNIMSYVPDFCVKEFTPGQLARMMTQVRRWKTYVYCNYANIIDSTTCTDDVPCVSTATNPRCK